MTREDVLSTLRGIVAEALRIDPDEVDVHRPLLELGASSLVLVDAFRSVQETFGVRPSTRKVFEQYSTVDRLADYLIELLETRTRRETPQDGRRAITRERLGTLLRNEVAGSLGRLPADVDLYTSFSRLGLSSLALARALAAVEEAVGVRPSLSRAIDEYPNIALLAGYILDLHRAQRSSAPPLTETVEEARNTHSSEGMPLSANQRQLWFLSQFSDGASAAHNETLLTSLAGRLDLPALHMALKAVVQRHEALRTRFSAERGVQEVLPAWDLELEEQDLSRESSASSRQQAAAWLSREVAKSFALERPLFRAAVLRFSEASSLLVLTAHNLVADRRSLYLIRNELAALYKARVDGGRDPLGDPLLASNYLSKLEQERGTARWMAAEAFWLEQCRGGLPGLELPVDRPRPPVQSYAGGRLVAPLPADLVKGLRRWSGEAGATLFGTVLAAFHVLLFRLTGQEELVIGVLSPDPVWGAGETALVANTVNRLVLRTQLDNAQTFRTCYDGIAKALRRGFDHRDYPFASLVEALNPVRDQSRPALFSVAFGAEPARATVAFGDLQAEAVTTPAPRVGYDLRLTVMEDGEAVQLVADYATDLFDGTTIRRWMGHLGTLLRGILAAPSSPLRALPLLTDEERRSLALASTAAPVPFDATRCIHQLFEAQADTTPDRVALVFEGRELSYRELERQANRLAHHLRRQGVGPGQRVGLCLPPSEQLVVAVIAILKAGAAYVPLDPAYPAARLAYILQDAAVPLVLTHSIIDPALISSAPARLDLDALKPALEDFSDERLPTTITPGETAYILYTSGSTGLPKGVPGHHRGVVSRMHVEPHPLEPVEVFCHKTSLNFIDSLWEIFMPLVHGYKTVVASEEARKNPSQLVQLMAEHGVTRMVVVPSLLRIIVESVEPLAERLPRLKYWISSGEPLTPELARKVQSATPGTTLVNLYGTSEVWDASWQDVTDTQKATLPIGRPLANMHCYILDQHLGPVPVGVPGELCIGGVGVSQGYLNRPEQTAERFVESPFEHGERIYRTGDLARWLPDLRIELVGRLDQQVKLRGHRVELGEVEEALVGVPEVGQAVVVVRDDDSDRRLVAYLVARPGSDMPPASELRSALRIRLPEYMIPAAFVMLKSLPLTPNGKIDRRSLPAPERDRNTSAERFVPPAGEVEEALATLFSRVLGMSRVGTRDSFFDLGGHSLMLTALLLEIRRRFGVGISLRDFFNTPTIAQLARWIDERRERPVARSFVESDQNMDPLGGPEARERFRFLRSEARLDPAIRPADERVPAGTRPRRVLLTGATGFVGSYLVRELLDQGDVELFCVVRAANLEEGHRRIRNSLESWGLWRPGIDQRITPVPGNLTEIRLGMTEEAFEALGRRIDLIIHSAAMVKFMHPYQALKPVNVGGTHEVIRLAFAGRTKPMHYVSTAAVFPMGAHRVFHEDTSIDQDLFLNLAYDETKWVAEKLLEQAGERGLPVTIYRMGEICGHSETGQSVIEHSVFAFMKGCIQLRAFPLVEARFDMAPVDYVTRAIAHIAMHPEAPGRAFHLNNPEPLDTQRVYDWFWRKGYSFEVVPFDEWRERVLNDEHLVDNALYPFVGLLEDYNVQNAEFPTYECTNTMKALEAAQVHCHPVNDRLLDTIFGFLTQVGFFPRPEELRD